MTFSPLIGSFKGIQEHPWTRDWSWWNPRLYTKHVQLKHNQNPNSFINLQSWRFSDGGWPQWVITDKCSEFSLLSFLWYHASTGTFLVHDYMCTTIALHIQKLWHTWHKRQVITLSWGCFLFLWRAVCTNHTSVIPLKRFKSDLLNGLELLGLQLLHLLRKYCFSRNGWVDAVGLDIGKKQKIST